MCEDPWHLYVRQSTAVNVWLHQYKTHISKYLSEHSWQGWRRIHTVSSDLCPWFWSSRPQWTRAASVVSPIPSLQRSLSTQISNSLPESVGIKGFWGAGSDAVSSLLTLDKNGWTAVLVDGWDPREGTRHSVENIPLFFCVSECWASLNLVYNKVINYMWMLQDVAS